MQCLVDMAFTVPYFAPVNSVEHLTLWGLAGGRRNCVDESISKNPRVYYVLMKFKIDYVAYEHVL